MERVASVLSRVIRQLGLEKEMLGWKITEEWADLVGPRISRHTRCVGFHDGTLRVEVGGAAWMHELRFLERELVRKANCHLGSDVVRDVRFVVPRGGSLR